MLVSNAAFIWVLLYWSQAVFLFVTCKDQQICSFYSRPNRPENPVVFFSPLFSLLSLMWLWQSLQPAQRIWISGQMTAILQAWVVLWSYLFFFSGDSPNWTISLPNPLPFSLNSLLFALGVLGESLLVQVWLSFSPLLVSSPAQLDLGTRFLQLVISNGHV